MKEGTDGPSGPAAGALDDLIKQWERVRHESAESVAHLLANAYNITPLSPPDTFIKIQQQVLEAIRPINDQIAALYSMKPPAPVIIVKPPTPLSPKQPEPE